jgi:hypothetical protein
MEHENIIYLNQVTQSHLADNSRNTYVSHRPRGDGAREHHLPSPGNAEPSCDKLEILLLAIALVEMEHENIHPPAFGSNTESSCGQF